MQLTRRSAMQTEAQMRRFKSVAQAQRFLSVHSIVRNLFNVGRHLLRAAHHRVLRTRSFAVWHDVTCGC
jgi:putative transposase